MMMMMVVKITNDDDDDETVYVTVKLCWEKWNMWTSKVPPSLQLWERDRVKSSPQSFDGPQKKIVYYDKMLIFVMMIWIRNEMSYWVRLGMAKNVEWQKMGGKELN